MSGWELYRQYLAWGFGIALFFIVLLSISTLLALALGVLFGFGPWGY